MIRYPVCHPIESDNFHRMISLALPDQEYLRMNELPETEQDVSLHRSCIIMVKNFRSINGRNR